MDMHIHVLKYVSQTIYYILVLVPLQINNINYIYTIMYMPVGVHSWHNYWLLCVNYNTSLRFDH